MILNDASGMNASEGQVLRARSLENLRDILAKAVQKGRTITVGGARHSMGGQSLPLDRNAIALEFPKIPITINEDRKSYSVGMGTPWREVTRTLDKAGLSVKIMQSNNDFSVGGTLSVNAHGWPAPYGPFGSSVKKFTIMMADGSVKRCSRDQNQELFSHVIGGYGLFGVVVDAELEAVPNCMMRYETKLTPAENFADVFTSGILDPSRTTLRMAYGRLSLSRDNFLKEASAVFGHATDGAVPSIVEKVGLGHKFARAVYDAQRGSELGKQARWFVESRVGPHVQTSGTRNAALSTSVDVFKNTREGYTDILHEYFLPPENFAEFLQACRVVIPGAGPELLNVTVRYLDTDRDSVLKFAPAPRIAAVMLFDQRKTPEADIQMQSMTRRLIDAAIELGGSYYLPYRLHAMQDQFQAAYPMADAFFQKKKQYDPNGLFTNTLLRTYG